MTKKIISLLLAATLMFSNGILSFADSEDTNAFEIVNAEGILVTESNIDSIYSLKTVDKLPEGVTPLVFETEADYIKFLDQLEANKDQPINIFANASNVESYNLTNRSNMQASFATTNTGTRNVRVEEKKYIGIGLNIMLYGYLNIDNGKITSVEPIDMSLVGWSPGIELNRDSIVTAYTISSSGYSSHISGECDIDLYAVVNVGELGLKLRTSHYTLNIYHGL